jgi:hypothetical protein
VFSGERAGEGSQTLSSLNQESSGNSDREEKRTNSPTYRCETGQRTFPRASEAKVPSTQSTAKIVKATRTPCRNTA